MLGTVQLVAGITFSHFVIYILLVSFTPSANPPVVIVDQRMLVIATVIPVIVPFVNIPREPTVRSE